MPRNSRTGVGRTGPRRRFAPNLDELAQLSGRITEMKAQEATSERISVFVDGEFALGLDQEVVLLARLRVGQEVEGPTLVQAIQRDEEKRAWNAALLLLGVMARTARELERRLMRTYSPQAVSHVMARLQSGGWIDDLVYARQFVQGRLEFGEHRLMADLIRRGVDRQVAQATVGELLGTDHQEQQARDLAAARLNRMPGADYATAYRRLAGLLARRGYGADLVGKILRPLLRDLHRGALQEEFD